MKKEVKCKKPGEQIEEFNSEQKKEPINVTVPIKKKIKWFHIPVLLVIVASLICIAAIPILTVIAIIKFLF